MALAVLLCCAALAATAVAFPDIPGKGADAGANGSGSGRYIVVLEDSVDHPGAVAEAQTERYDGDLGFIYRHVLNGYSAKLSRSAVKALRKSPNVKFVEADRRVETFAQETVSGVKRIGAHLNPDLDIDEIDDARINVDVAVIDTGIDHTHPDLNVVSRTNCVPPSEKFDEKLCVENDGVDGDGHGTHVAGTIGAIDNGFGVVGTAPGARLWALRALNNEGRGWEAWIIAAIEWVTAHAGQIEVVNMSLGGRGRSLSEEAAIRDSVEAGVVYVVAAGNSASNAEGYAPANGPDVITVSALADEDGEPGGKGAKCKQNPDDTLAGFSNWGSAVEIAAPGNCIGSTLPVKGSSYGVAEYGVLSGTSMASPHVAGVAAVMASKANPSNKADVEAIRQALVDQGSLNWSDTSEDGKPEPVLFFGPTPLTTPEVATGGWSSTDGKSATLFGAVSPHGVNTQYYFEYGPTAAYGSSVPASPASAETTYSRVSQQINNLQRAQTYHYRLVITSGAGTVYGQDRTFTTSRWEPQSPGGPPEEWEDLQAVDCVSATWCMAVGYSEALGVPDIVAHKFSGGQWVKVSLPVPAEGSQPVMNQISCASSSMCMAVGTMILPGKVVPLIFKWNGTAWSMQSAPEPPNEAESPLASLEGVSCASSTECTAVGFYRVSSPTSWRTFVSVWKGGEWSNQFPLPLGGGLMEDVSCTSSQFCAASGSSGFYTWNGTIWAARSHEVPAEEGSFGFEDVSCVSQSFCLVVANMKYVEAWDGSDLTLVERAESPILFDVSCLSPLNCTAVGATFGTRDLVASENWNGSAMVPQTAQLYEAEKHGAFFSVDCYQSSGCTAVGQEQYEWARPLIATGGLNPVVTTKEPSGLYYGDVALRGDVNPQGYATTYRFEWGTKAEFLEGKYGNSLPVPDASAGSGESEVPVSAPLPGLKGSTEYHFRIVAQSSEGTTVSPDRAFTTGDWRPEIRWQRQKGVGRKAVSLYGAINPKSHATTYRFEWGTQAEFEEGKYGHSVPVPDKAIGSGTEDVEVTQTVEGLQERKTYHFRLIAENSEGKSTGADQLMKTSTSGFAAGKYPATISGEVTGSSPVLSFPGGASFTCPGAFAFTGTATAPFEALTHQASEGGACSKLPVEEKATLKMGTCGFVLRPGPETSPGQFAGSFDIGPPGCGPIVLDGESCDRSFASQAGFDATFANEGSGEAATVRVDANASGLKYTVTGPPAFCGGASTASLIGTWKVKAKSGGVSTGVVVTGMFKTAPTATSAAASAVTPSKATLNGSVNPNLLETTYQFEYGPTASYGTKVPASPKAIGAGAASVAVSESLSGLKPNSTYHYRVVATNAEGTTYGADLTFATPPHRVTRLEAEGYPATIAATQSPSAKHVLTFQTRPFECETVNGSATIGGPGDRVPLAMTYAGCQGTILGTKLPATVKMNGCAYALNVKSTGSPFSAKLDVTCAKEGEAIEAMAYLDAEKQAKNEPLCTYKIAPQSGRETISLTNSGSGSGRVVSAALNLTGLAYTKTQGTLANCGIASNNATYVGTSTLAGSGEKGTLGVFVTAGEAPTGLFAASGKLEAESYPVDVAAEQSPSATQVLSFSTRPFECQTVFGDGKLSAASSQVSLEATYSGCQGTILGTKLPATVKMNGCSYRLNVQAGGPPFSAKLDVTCAKEGEAIEALAYLSAEKQAKNEPLCTYKIAPQSNLAGISLTNLGAGSERRVATAFNLTGIAYTKTQGTLANCGAASGSGTNAGGSTLYAFG
ncbi:MAG TPA: S8 family peptidase [Solirubrobacterales bacterium]|nr:S8 family peptidase [Solirubrobacterales bacterium]